MNGVDTSAAAVEAARYVIRDDARRARLGGQFARGVELGAAADVLAALAAERDALRAALTAAERERGAARALVDAIQAHDIESLSCDRDGEIYCECVSRAAASLRARLDAPAGVAPTLPRSVTWWGGAAGAGAGVVE